MILFLAFLVLIGAGIAVYNRIDVRLTLLLAALLLGGLAGNITPIFHAFFDTFANERFVVPICMAMGFAYVLRHTECDQHLVRLLLKPLVKVRWALIPGTVVVGFLVNIPIISQTSTAVTLGAVVIPILIAARLSPVTIGATLLLGCSVGGELLNPGAPELRTTVEESNRAYQELGTNQLPVRTASLVGVLSPSLGEQPLRALSSWRMQQIFHTPPIVRSSDVVRQILPLNILGLLAATVTFWWISARAESRYQHEHQETMADKKIQESAKLEVNLLKAMVPVIPLILLVLAGRQLQVIPFPQEWLVNPSGPRSVGLFDSRLIGFAMLVGVGVAALVSWKTALQVPRAFFEGAGYGFANIISLIVTANCFGAAIREIGIADQIGNIISSIPVLLMPFSGILPWGFAVLCGSGMASTQSLFGFFALPAVQQNVDPTLVGAVVSLASAAGRTMSPVAAVCLMCSTLTDTNPFALVQRVAWPLMIAVAVVVVTAMVMTMSAF